jgi:hypothetical protein
MVPGASQDLHEFRIEQGLHSSYLVRQLHFAIWRVGLAMRGLASSSASRCDDWYSQAEQRGHQFGY